MTTSVSNNTNDPNYNPYSVGAYPYNNLYGRGYQNQHQHHRHHRRQGYGSYGNSYGSYNPYGSYNQARPAAAEVESCCECVFHCHGLIP